MLYKLQSDEISAMQYTAVMKKAGMALQKFQFIAPIEHRNPLRR